MIPHVDVTAEDVRSKIKHKEIRYGGNKKLKIYGTLHCTSGKVMKRENRFFLVQKTKRWRRDSALADIV